MLQALCPEKIDPIREKRKETRVKGKKKEKTLECGTEMARFTLGERVLGEREFSYAAFENIGQKIEFKCSECSCKNIVLLLIYRAGKPISRLLCPAGPIAKSELINNRAIREKISKSKKNEGELMVGFTSARFEMVPCHNCQKSYITIFGMDEVQMGREIVEISGIWELVSL
ncbi:MAG: hypothetical protein AAFN38_25040 [Cyanobacteria bacterium J06560_5]